MKIRIILQPYRFDQMLYLSLQSSITGLTLPHIQVGFNPRVQDKPSLF